MTPADIQFAALPKERCIYARAEASVPLDLVIGRGRETIDATSGAILAAPSADFIARVSDLVLSGEPITPQQSDTITRPNGMVYQLMTPAFDPHDHGGLYLRIHSKKVA